MNVITFKPLYLPHQAASEPLVFVTGIYITIEGKNSKLEVKKSPP